MAWIWGALLSRFSFAFCNLLDSHYCNGVFKSSYSQSFFGAIYYVVALPFFYLLI